MFILEEFCKEGLENVVIVAKLVINVIRFVAPIILIVLGSIDLIRAVIAGKEDDIKKHQGILIKRVIAAVILFLVPTIVSILMGLLGEDSWKNCWNNTQGSIKKLIEANQIGT